MIDFKKAFQADELLYGDYEKVSPISIRYKMVQALLRTENFKMFPISFSSFQPCFRTGVNPIRPGGWGKGGAQRPR